MASQKILKKKSCLFSVSVYGWRLYQVDAINQFRHMIKTKGLKRPINLFRCVPCPTFTTNFSSIIQYRAAPSLSSVPFVFLVICLQSTNTRCFLQSIYICLLSFAVFTCLCLCMHQGEYALSYHHGYASHILSFVSFLSPLYLSLWPGASLQYPCHGCASSN